MTRRGAREGSIRQRPNGSWEARYRAADGGRRSVYGPTRREAQDRLRAALAAADNGIRPVSQVLTVGAWLDEWLEASVRPRLRPATVTSYQATVRLYLRPAIGRIPLARLTPEDVGRMVNGLTARRELSPTTVRYALTILRIALRRAVRSGRAVRNVAELIDQPRAVRHEVRPLSIEEVSRFLASVRGDRLETLYITAIGLGLRQGELLGLRWADVDLDGGSLTVTHSLSGATRQLAEPKTDQSHRTIRLGSEVAAALRDHRRVQLEDRIRAGSAWVDTGHVFATATGRPLDGTNVTHRFQAALKRAGMRRQRFHDLRHASATLRLEQGEELAVVSKILGHASITTTANVYGHLTDAMLDRAAERMDGILSRRRA
jgi:integrase